MDVSTGLNDNDGNVLNMKKIFLIILIMGICLSSGIYLWQSRTYKTVQVPDITPNQLQEMSDKGDNFYVYFYSPICEECIKSEPKLIEAVKELMINNIVKVDVQKYDYLRKDLQIQGTPSIFVYSNHKIIKGITGGFKTVDEYKNFFRETVGQVAFKIIARRHLLICWRSKDFQSLPL